MGATLGLVAGLVGLAVFCVWLAVRASREIGESDAKADNLEAEARARAAFDRARDRTIPRGALISELRRIASRARSKLPGPRD